jgi:uncharacterized caspase-like protein
VPLQAGVTHRIEARADSDVSFGISRTVEVTFQRSDDKRRLPALYVLAIGVSDYMRDELDLRYADDDARRLDGTVRRCGKGLFAKVATKLIVDQEATQRGILKGFAWLRSQMTQHDVALILFSGHGDKDAGGAFYLVPHDVEPGLLEATGVSDAQLKSILQGTPGRLLLMLDACHAGSSAGDNRKGLARVSDDLVRDLASDDYGIVVMASSMGREFSLECETSQAGYFTLAVTEGLSGKADANQDGLVYSTELDAYVSERVKELSNGRQHPVTAKPGTIRSFPLARP